MKIHLNGNLCVAVSCTPVDMKGLAAGWLLSEGYPGSRPDGITVVSQKEELFVSVDDQTDKESSQIPEGDTVLWTRQSAGVCSGM